MAMTPQEGALQLKSAVRDEPALKVFYRHAGDGPPMIWLHWLWGEPGWMPQHERLAERHSLYVPDIPGFGQSGPLPRWASRPRDIAILILQAIDQWGLERPTIVGSCLGGWIGAEMASLRPERIGSLVLVAPLGLVIDWTQMPNVFYANPDDIPGYFSPSPDSEAALAYLPHRRDWNPTFLANRITSTKITFDPYLHSRTLPHRLYLATPRALIIWGSSDPLLSSDHAALWAAHLPNSEARIISRAGHLPYVEDCDAVVGAIDSFVVQASD